MGYLELQPLKLNLAEAGEPRTTGEALLAVLGTTVKVHVMTGS